MNNIYTIDFDSNIYVGNIEVIDKEGLKKFRDELMEYFISNTSRNEIILPDLYRSGLYYDKNNEVIKECHRNQISKFETDSVIVYDETTYINKFVKVILIFTSLLGDEINISDYNNYLTKYLIVNGLFKNESFDKIWNKYSSIIVNEEYKVRTKNDSDDAHAYNFGAFKFAMDNGFIKYNITDKLSFKDNKFNKIIRGISHTDIEQIKCNSELLLGDQYNRRLKIKK